MKKYTFPHERLALKITFFGIGFLIVFFGFFLLFSFTSLLDSETKELQSISQINLGVTSTGIVIAGGGVMSNVTTVSAIETGVLTGEIQELKNNILPSGVAGVVTISTAPQILLEGENITPLPLQKQRIFELTRDSLVQTKEGNIFKNGIFTYESFDISGLFNETKEIFTEKINGEYYLFYKTNLEGDTYIFAQNVDYIVLFIHKSILICFVSILLFSICLFFLSRYLIQLFMKPIEENNIRLKEYNHNLAHEIKTPLTVITLNLGTLENSQNQEIIESTREEVFKIKNITDTLLFLSENFVVKKKELVGITPLVEAFIQKYPDKKAIEFIHKDIDMKVSIDVNMFERLLKNLIENALKYSSDQKVYITLQKDTIFFTNKVAKNIDTSKLFDMFFQGDNSRVSQGYGLGLTLVKRIVEILGWQIQLSCEKKVFIVKIIL